MEKYKLALIIIIAVIIGMIIGYYLLPYLVDLISAEGSVFGPSSGTHPPALPE